MKTLATSFARCLISARSRLLFNGLIENRVCGRRQRSGSRLYSSFQFATLYSSLLSNKTLVFLNCQQYVRFKINRKYKRLRKLLKIVQNYGVCSENYLYFYSGVDVVCSQSVDSLCSILAAYYLLLLSSITCPGQFSATVSFIKWKVAMAWRAPR